MSPRPFTQAAAYDGVNGRHDLKPVPFAQT